MLRLGQERSAEKRPEKDLLPYLLGGDFRVMQLPYSEVWSPHEGGSKPGCTAGLAYGNLSSS